MTDGLLKDTMVNMKWTDIQDYSNKKAIVLLPLGVVEEHGPHLCLGTDIYTAHIYCLEIKKRLEQKGYTAVIAPPFYWGVCQATRGFIGSFNIRLETAKMLLFDILASLKDFGFSRVFGVNAHGDVEHAIAVISAFKEASAQLGMTACFPFPEDRLFHYGLKGDEPYISPLKPQQISVSQAAVPDFHGGDMETATINAYYPHLVDVEKAKSLPDVPLGDDQGEKWLFGGHTKELSPEGYLGAPAYYDRVDVKRNINDYAIRITEAILNRIEKS
jgi:creatinine amidohydrolase